MCFNNDFLTECVLKMMNSIYYKIERNDIYHLGYSGRAARRNTLLQIVNIQ